MQTIEYKNIFFNKLISAKWYFLILLFSLTSNVAYSAGVGLNATRIVFLQGSESTSVGARNNTDINYLAKFIVSKSPEGLKGDAPFTVSPPLVKIDSGKSQDIRIYSQPNNLPKDRESVFYFNAVMIPATNGPLESTALNIGYNNVIKLFYRPSKLPLSPKEAHERLRVESNSTGITVINDSPYYISLSNLSVNGVKIDMSMKKRNTMIAPYDSFNYIAPVNGRKELAKWVVINDLGGDDVYTGQVK